RDLGVIKTDRIDRERLQLRPHILKLRPLRGQILIGVGDVLPRTVQARHQASREVAEPGRYKSALEPTAVCFALLTPQRNPQSYASSEKRCHCGGPCGGYLRSDEGPKCGPKDRRQAQDNYDATSGYGPAAPVE